MEPSPLTRRFYQSLRPVARWLPVRLPQSVPLVASSGQGQAAYARVRAEIQRNPGAVGDPTPNFVPPQVTAPQQQLMMQRLLESGEKRSTTALIVVLYIATLVVWWDKSGYRDGPNRMKQKAATR